MTESLFGKHYNVVGESSSSLLLKSNGTVKVQWGNKFIDLIKNGKINTGSQEINSIFFKINSDSEFKENGIYLLNDQIYIYIDRNKILLNSSEQSYVSFTIDQELNSQEKGRALTNIGFYYNTIEDVKNSEITSGIVYVKDENKLYTVVNSAINEYSVYSSNNSLNQDEISVSSISSEFLNFIISSEQILILDSKGINAYSDIIIENNHYIKSKDANENYGFRLYNSDSFGSVLEIDSVIIRKSLTYSNYIDIEHNSLYNLYINKKVELNRPYRIINYKGVQNILQEDIVSDEDIYAINIYPIIITFRSLDNYECYFEYNSNLKIRYDITPKEYTINSATYTSRGTITYLEDEYGNIANFDFKHIKFYHNNIPYYLFSNEVGEENSISYKYNTINLNDILIQDIVGEQLTTIEGTNYLIFTISSNNIEFKNLNSSAFINYKFDNNIVYNNWKNVISTVSITNCQFKQNVSNINISKIIDQCIFYHEIDNTDLFRYEFNNCEFRSSIINNIEQPDSTIITILSNNELKQVSVYQEDSLYKLRVQSDSITVIPSGTIVMWHGSEIPYGWAICDGNNGTPNLIGKFIKASTSSGDIESDLNENNELVLTKDHLPKHQHSHQPHTHSINFSNIEGETSYSGSLSVNLNYSDYAWDIRTSETTVVDSIDSELTHTTTSVVSSVSNRTQGGTASGGNHTHSFSISGDDISCQEATSIELDNENWLNKPIKIEPRSYALIFIMKL